VKKMVKKEEPKITKTEEITELTPYEAMDIADEEQIIDELEGKLTPEDAEKFVYSFPDKTTGREIIGLSWKGTKATWWELNKQKLTDMTITDKLMITQGNGFVDVAVYAYDSLRKIGAWGMARGYTETKAGGMMVQDRFASAKAMSKAQRNALGQLFPTDLVAKLIKEWIAKGHIKILTAQSAYQVRQQVFNVSTRRTQISQQDLMKQFKMDLSQVPPKCPNCGATMMLMARKDGSGIFWSCVNWRTKGCKGYNVDEVDIDGTITMKQPKQQAKTKQNQSTSEDIPF